MSQLKTVFVCSLLTLFALFFTIAERTHAQSDIGPAPTPALMADLSCTVIVTNQQQTLTNGSTTTFPEFWVTYVVHNAGPGAANNFAVRRGVNMTSGNISLLPQTLTLAAGESRLFAPVRLQGHPTLSYADIVQAWGIVDTSNVVVESNELNNMCGIQFTIELVH